MKNIKKIKEQPQRIPYENWVNSQLSIARYYGGCTINGKEYRLDYDNAAMKVIDGEECWFPDLVEVVKK